MLKYVSIVFLLFGSLQPISALAQLDPSSGLLFRSGRKSTGSPTLDSSRYKIRQPESRKDDDDLDEKPGTFIASPVPSKPPKSKPAVEVKNINVNESKAVVVESKTPSDSKASEPSPLPAPVVSKTQPDPATIEGIEVEQPPVAVQVRELIMGGSNQDIDDYRSQIHPEDPRANILAITFAPGYYYNASDSEYSFRRYHSNGPGLGLGMNFWMTPFFGLQSKFFTSVSGTQRSGGNNMVTTEIQTFAIGVRFRRHFGYSRKAAQLSWGIDYADAKNKISSEAVTAVGRKSSGLSFSLEGEIPLSVGYSHVFELNVMPRMKHSETATGVEVRSGTKNETNALSLSLGGAWTLDRRDQVFWKGQYTVERNLFDGTADTTDPHSGLTPKGVSVNNSLIIFYFGFKWGS